MARITPEQADELARTVTTRYFKGGSGTEPGRADSDDARNYFMFIVATLQYLPAGVTDRIGTCCFGDYSLDFSQAKAKKLLHRIHEARNMMHLRQLCDEDEK